MALRGNKKGMLSTMDAMLFLSIMIVVCAGFFAYGIKTQDEETMAKTVATDFLSVRLLSSDVYPTEDGQVFPVADLVAAQMLSGKGSALAFAESALRGMVPVDVHYKAVFKINGRTASVGDGKGTPSSEYACVQEIAGKGQIEFSLALF